MSESVDNPQPYRELNNYNSYFKLVSPDEKIGVIGNPREAHFTTKKTLLPDVGLASISGLHHGGYYIEPTMGMKIDGETLIIGDHGDMREDLDLFSIEVNIDQPLTIPQGQIGIWNLRVDGIDKEFQAKVEKDNLGSNEFPSVAYIWRNTDAKDTNRYELLVPADPAVLNRLSFKFQIIKGEPDPPYIPPWAHSSS